MFANSSTKYPLCHILPTANIKNYQKHQNVFEFKSFEKRNFNESPTGPPLSSADRITLHPRVCFPRSDGEGDRDDGARRRRTGERRTHRRGGRATAPRPLPQILGRLFSRLGWRSGSRILIPIRSNSDLRAKKMKPLIFHHPTMKFGFHEKEGGSFLPFLAARMQRCSMAELFPWRSHFVAFLWVMSSSPL